MREIKIDLQDSNRIQVFELINEFRDYYFSLDFDVNEIAKKYTKNACFVIAYSEDKPVGYVAYYRNSSDLVAYVSMVVMNTEYRRMGIASRMMKMVIDDCRLHNYKVVRLEVNDNNRNAICLYSKLDFIYESKASDNTSYYKLEMAD